MKYILPLLFLSTSCLADTFDIKRDDHKLHLITSYAATISLSTIYDRIGLPEPRILAMATVLTMGVIKETHDKEFSHGDMAGNMFGAMSGLIFCYTFNL